MNTEQNSKGSPWWKLVVVLLGPSVLLFPVLALYITFEGTPHFFLHTLVGWDVALVVLLGATTLGRSLSTFDGLLPLGLALYALTPDFIYRFGPFHRDWMDLFLFHVALDETLPFVLPLLIVLWIVLLIGYLSFCARTLRSPKGQGGIDHGSEHAKTMTLPFLHHHRLLKLVLVASILTLIILTISSVAIERTTQTPSIQRGATSTSICIAFHQWAHGITCDDSWASGLVGICAICPM